MTTTLDGPAQLRDAASPDVGRPDAGLPDAGRSAGDGLDLLPGARPVRLLDASGAAVADAGRDYAAPPLPVLRDAYRRMVAGRRFDTQATALTRQGRLAVYPSSRGQEACQVAAAMALRPTDWLFPTYRDSTALVSRGIDPVEVLTLLRGDRHCGYDPVSVRTAPQCTPLATQTLHAAGLAWAERRQGRDTVALAVLGDGATSEGDFSEALNFAAVFAAPVVFLVQNNGWAISVPLSRQSAAPSLAAKGIGAGVAAERVDGNDLPATLAVLTAAVERARAGGGPMLVEALTYRMEAHTNADDAGRYRDPAEVAAWAARDPLDRLARYLRDSGALDDAGQAADDAAAEALAADLRARIVTDPARPADPLELFDHVYATPTPQLTEQRAMLAAELAADAAAGAGTRAGVGGSAA